MDSAPQRRLFKGEFYDQVDLHPQVHPGHRLVAKLRESFKKDFDSEAYKAFNQQNLFTPAEIDGDQVAKDWSANAAKYKDLAVKYDVDLGGGK